MKTTISKRVYLSVLLIFSIAFFSYAQIGIGTTTPASGSILDIQSADKGVMMPRIHLANINDAAAITPAPTTGLLIFNTNTAGSGSTSVSQGFYYWNGSQWVRLQTSTGYWKTDGNDDVVNGVHFVGTTDNTDLDFRTNNVGRLRIPGEANQIQALADGTNALPFYSWASDTDIGMWRPGANQLALSAGGQEFFRIIGGATNELVINEGGVDINTRVETIAEPNMLFIDGGTNRIGVKTNNPQTELHIAGNGNTLRIDELNQANNVNYTSNDYMPVYVNTNGDFTLQPSLIQNFLPVNNINFLNPSVSIQSSTGAGLFVDLHTVNITLTQASLVQVNYQMSVDITRHDGTVITDGATRLYRSWVEVNGAATHIGYDSGTYNNNNATGPFANENYYLAGNGYIQLPAGTHELRLRALGFGGDNSGTGTHSYRLTFGANNHDRFLVTVHR